MLGEGRRGVGGRGGGGRGRAEPQLLLLSLPPKVPIWEKTKANQNSGIFLGGSRGINLR